MSPTHVKHLQPVTRIILHTCVCSCVGPTTRVSGSIILNFYSLIPPMRQHLCRLHLSGVAKKAFFRPQIFLTGSNLPRVGISELRNWATYLGSGSSSKLIPQIVYFSSEKQKFRKNSSRLAQNIGRNFDTKNTSSRTTGNGNRAPWRRNTTNTNAESGVTPETETN